MPDLLANLNPEQLVAVTLPAQSALILAGAGSGKTKVLTTRIAWLISTGQVTQHGILAVTFTNKAAKEMQVRLGTMVPVNTRAMWIGTFHGLCNRFLRAHHREAGLPKLFQILDSGDQLSAIKRLCKALNVSDEKYPPKQVMYFINSAKESGQRARDIVANDDFNKKFVELYSAYDEQCNKEGVVDFSELLLRTYEVLKANQLIREHYRSRFRHILVDEFQDTNQLQYDWLRLMAGESGAPGSSVVFGVGDDDQSIYAFRGARVGNMHDFERDFRVGNIIKLEQNYRSHGNILDAANALIKNNSGRLGKNLWTAAGHGEPIRVYEAQTDLEEAQWLMHEIKALIGEGARRSEIALLYRSNAQSRAIEHALFTEGIPYKVYGGLRFFERQEVKHALAYLRLIANPDDDTAFARVVNFPPRGIGARSMELLSDAANQRDMANPAGISLWRAVGAVQGKGGTSLAAFVKLIDEMRATTANLPLEEVMDHVLDHSTLRTHYRNDHKEGQERLENLEELISAAKGFNAEEEDVLSAFLAHASLEAGDNQANEGQDAVQLMTVHAAKGLEFNAVFITGLEEGLFPHENSLLEVAGLDEERRLMYVAITRARKNLYISFAQTRMMHGQTRYNMKSRFLIELPEGVLKWLTPRGGLAPVSNKWWAGDDDATPRAKTWSNFGSSSSSSSITKYVETGYGSGSSNNGIPQANPREANPGVPWKLGQSVKHAKFGEGVVVRIEGSGNDARLHINFGRQGVKQLALAFAKLEAA